MRRPSIRVVVREKDVVRQVFRSGGPGGQNQNKVSTGVRYIHSPTGISGEARDTRSQEDNGKLAYDRMIARLEAAVALKMGLGNRVQKKPATFANWDRDYRLVGKEQFVVDRRTGHEERSARSVLDGKLDGFIASGLAEAVSQEIER